MGCDLGTSEKSGRRPVFIRFSSGRVRMSSGCRPDYIRGRRPDVVRTWFTLLSQITRFDSKTTHALPHFVLSQHLQEKVNIGISPKCPTGFASLELITWLQFSLVKTLYDGFVVLKDHVVHEEIVVDWRHPSNDFRKSGDLRIHTLGGFTVEDPSELQILPGIADVTWEVVLFRMA